MKDDYGVFGGAYLRGRQIAQLKNWCLVRVPEDLGPRGKEPSGVDQVRIIGWKARARRYLLDERALAHIGVKPEQLGEFECEFRFASLGEFFRCRGKILTVSPAVGEPVNAVLEMGGPGAPESISPEGDRRQ